MNKRLHEGHVEFVLILRSLRQMGATENTVDVQAVARQHVIACPVVRAQSLIFSSTTYS